MKRIILLVFLFLVVSLPNCLAIEGDTTKEDIYTGESSKVFKITISPSKKLDEQQTIFLTTSDEEINYDNDDDTDDLMDDLMKPLKFFTRTIHYKF